MTALSSVITDVRDTTMDTTATYRVSDATMIVYANDCIRTLIHFKPDLFSTIGEIACTAGTCLQQIPTGAIQLEDIFQVKSGKVVREIERDVLDAFNPNWWNDTAAAAENWIRYPKTPTQFLIYPKAPNSQILIGRWAATPTALAATTDAIPIPDAYIPHMHSYMVWRAEWREDEYANSGKAQLGLQNFIQLVGVAKVGKQEMDALEKTIVEIAR